MNFYCHHIGDYLRDCVGLSMLEDGAYRRLLDAYYAAEGPLPAAKAELYRAARAFTDDERRAVDYVVGKFFVVDGDRIQQKRADIEIASYRAKSAKASESAKRKWELERKHSERNANAMRTHSERSADAMLTNNQEPLTIKTLKPKPKAAAAAPPAWLPEAEWGEWLKHRGTKATPQAVNRQLAKLSALRDEGHDPREVIALAIESGWATFYPPRAPPPASKSSKAGRREEICRQMFGDIVGKRADVIDITAEVKRVAG